MPVDVVYQFPIIHNRNAYKKRGQATYPLKCYEWSRARDSWETMLVFFVFPDGSAVDTFSYGSSKTVTQKIGLAIHQTLTIETELYGVDPDNLCGRDSLTIEEILPVPPGERGGAFGNVLVASQVYDPHAQGWMWVSGCAMSGGPIRSCRVVSDVTSVVKLVVATVNGRPFDSSALVPGETAKWTKVTRVDENTKTGEKASGDAPVDAGTKVTELKDQPSSTHRYEAEVNHCDVSALVNVRVTDDEDIPAGTVPSELRPPRHIQEALSKYLQEVAGGRPPRDHRSAHLGWISNRPQVPAPAHVTLGHVFAGRARTPSVPPSVSLDHPLVPRYGDIDV